MTTSDLVDTIRRHWGKSGDRKSGRYVDQFFERTVSGPKISGKVIGNHGTYTVSITVQSDHVSSGCSCYIGKRGGCHHVTALALTYLRKPDSFVAVKASTLDDVTNLEELKTYLQGVSLDELTLQLRQSGITQKALAESIGMNPQLITAMKSSERRNRFFGELGATKLACLWILEHISKDHESP